MRNIGERGKARCGKSRGTVNRGTEQSSLKFYNPNIGNKTGGLCPPRIPPERSFRWTLADPPKSPPESNRIRRGSDWIRHQLADSPPNLVRQPDLKLKLSSASWWNRSAADLFLGRIVTKKFGGTYPPWNYSAKMNWRNKSATEYSPRRNLAELFPHSKRIKCLEVARCRTTWNPNLIHAPTADKVRGGISKLLLLGLIPLRNSSANSFGGIIPPTCRT